MSIFTYLDIIKSSTALKHNIDNNPKTWKVINNARYSDVMMNLLFKLFHEKVNIKIKALKINSWFRCEELNKLVKGSKNSDHLEAKAIDFKILGLTPKKACEIIKNSYLLYDQLIQEPSWVHISFEEIDFLNKKEFLIKTKTGYIKG